MTIWPVGAWVAFYQDGRITYAAVLYTRRNVIGQTLLCTTHGEITDSAVLEVRPPTGEGETP